MISTVFNPAFYERDAMNANPCKKIGAFKSFFKPFKLAKIISYFCPTISPMMKEVKSVEKALTVSKVVANAIEIFKSSNSYWKKTQLSFKLVGATARSILWFNDLSGKKKPLFFSAQSVATLEKVSVVTKLLVATWYIADSSIKLKELAEVCPATRSKAQKLSDKKKALTFSLMINVIKFLAEVVLLASLLIGVVVPAPWLLFLYAFLLCLRLGLCFFEGTSVKQPYLEAV